MGCKVGFNEPSPVQKANIIFSLTLPDLTPNPGLWWYFFTEMFDHFRPFFLMVFSVRRVNLEGFEVYRLILGASHHIYRARLHQISVGRFHLLTSLGCLTMPRHDALYASFLLLGILGTFKAYLTLADPGLFLSMFAIFPEVYPCVFASPRSSSYFSHIFKTFVTQWSPPFCTRMHRYYFRSSTHFGLPKAVATQTSITPPVWLWVWQVEPESSMRASLG